METAMHFIGNCGLGFLVGHLIDLAGHDPARSKKGIGYVAAFLVFWCLAMWGR